MIVVVKMCPLGSVLATRVLYSSTTHCVHSSFIRYLLETPSFFQQLFPEEIKNLCRIKVKFQAIHTKIKKKIKRLPIQYMILLAPRVTDASISSLLPQSIIKGKLH